MKCPRCRTAQLVTINLSIQASRVTLHTCPDCELRWWDREGERLELGSVLELASARS